MYRMTILPGPSPLDLEGISSLRQYWLLLLLAPFVLLFSACTQAAGTKSTGTAELPIATLRGGALARVTSTAIAASTVNPTLPSTQTPESTINADVTLTTLPTVDSTAPSSTTPNAVGDNGVNFDGRQAYVQLEAQMELGPRWPGSQGHVAVGDYIVSELEKSGWAVEQQLFEYMGVEGRNIIGRANVGQGDVTIVGAHYDTRRVADQTPGAVEAQTPVPGAVDGASGVAVLLELARSLDLDGVPGEVWLAFFDLEDNGGGGLPGWEWIVGSTYMAENLEIMPAAMVLVDMIGDADQQLYYEGNSDPKLRETLWTIAADLGYGEAFIPELNYTMIDDHVPFAQRGIPAVDIIDFDYPYWHTVEDTADKASPASLERVGRTIEVWLEAHLE